jgi:hypothetical protein
MNLKTFTRGLAVAAWFAAGQALAQTALCYNCPPEWADWGSQLRAIKAKTGITVPPDNKNSGQSLAQLVAEKASPVADVTYLGVTFGIQARKEGVVTPYKPATWNDIPNGLKDPDGNWFTIHSGTLGFMVNVDALKGKRVVNHPSVKPPGGAHRGEITHAPQEPKRHARCAATPFGNRLQGACRNSLHPQQPGSARQDGNNIRHRIEAKIVRNSKA